LVCFKIKDEQVDIPTEKSAIQKAAALQLTALMAALMGDEE
jgi:hypothetical protein